jgi:hypothetical protein
MEAYQVVIKEKTVNEWEYKTCFMEFTPNNPEMPYAGHTQQVLTDAQLTQFGSEGWELVSVVRLTIAGVNPNIKLVGEYNYPGGLLLSLFSARLS